MGLCVVNKEKILILSICFNPVFELYILNKFVVMFVAVVTRLVTKKNLLEVGIIKNIRIHCPSRLRSFFQVTLKTNSLTASYESDIIFWFKI